MELSVWNNPFWTRTKSMMVSLNSSTPAPCQLRCKNRWQSKIRQIRQIDQRKVDSIFYQRKILLSEKIESTFHWSICLILDCHRFLELNRQGAGVCDLGGKPYFNWFAVIQHNRNFCEFECRDCRRVKVALERSRGMLVYIYFCRKSKPRNGNAL